jgi:hypothetical protein
MENKPAWMVAQIRVEKNRKSIIFSEIKGGKMILQIGDIEKQAK